MLFFKRIFDTKANPLYNLIKFFLIFLAINLITFVICILINLGIDKETLGVMFAIVYCTLIPIVLLDALDAIVSYYLKSKPLLNTVFDVLVLLVADIALIVVGVNNSSILGIIVVLFVLVNSIGLPLIVSRHKARIK